MVVVVRVDSSIQIGSGHVMRCLTLTGQLRKLGAEIVFICSESEGNIVDLILGEGYAVERFPCIETSLQNNVWESDLKYTQKILFNIERKVDWLIVDHYGLDARWESAIRPYAKMIMVIDDLANRKHDCDILLDQNFYLDMENRYKGLVPSRCKKLLGPEYALLRSEFYEERRNLRERDGKVRRILLFFGGSDPMNETQKALEAIKLINRADIAIDVVVGIANPNKERICQLCNDMPIVTFHCQIDNMAHLMANADLAVGAGGAVTWERCFLGLPSITIVVAENQRQVTEAVAKFGATLYIGESSVITKEKLSEFIMEVLKDSTKLLAISKQAMKLMGNFT